MKTITIGKMKGHGPYEHAYGWLVSGYAAKSYSLDFYGFIFGCKTFGINIVDPKGGFNLGGDE